MTETKILSSSLSPDQKLLDGRLNEFATPDSIVDLVGFLGAKFEPGSVLDPACGTGGFIDSFLKYSKKSSFNIKGVEINKAVAKAAMEKFEAQKKVVIENKDSLSAGTFKNSERYDLVMCDPPFGRRLLGKGAYLNTETAFLDKCLSLVNKEGHLIIVIPDGVLSRSDKGSKDLRQRIIQDFNLIAVFSLPAYIYAQYTSGRSSIKASILVIKNAKASDRGMIFGDFKDSNFKKDYLWECISESGKTEPPLFLIGRNKITDEVELHRHLPLEHKIGIKVQAYPSVKLSEIAEIIPIRKISELGLDSLILRKVGNFKIVSRDHLGNISEKTIKNYCLLRIKQNLSIDFLKLIFESEIFQKQVGLISRGEFIRSLRERDIGEIEIPLPPLSEQSRIAENYRVIAEIIADVGSLREKMLQDPFSKEILLGGNITKGLKPFSDQAISSTLEDLPSPIAIVLRQTKNIISSKDNLNSSVALLETLIKFMATLVIMESYQKHLFKDIPKILSVSFVQPSIGIWFAAFRNITRGIRDLDKKGELVSSLVSRQIVANSNVIIGKIEDTRGIRIRNDYLGHGAIGIPDEIYSIKNDEIKDLNEFLLKEVTELLDGYGLVYIISYKKKGNERRAKLKWLMGENRDFIAEEVIMPLELETEKVLLVSQDCLTCIPLDPLLHLGVCSECGTENLFFFDKRDKNHAQYFSYLHSHKTTFDLLEDIKKILPLSQ